MPSTLGIPKIGTTPMIIFATLNCTGPYEIGLKANIAATYIAANIATRATEYALLVLISLHLLMSAVCHHETEG